MFHNSTTIWHNHSGNDPLNVREKRMVFGAWESLKRGADKTFSGLAVATRPFRGIAKGVFKVTTAPTRIPLWMAKKTYDLGINPTVTGINRVLGAGQEVGRGAWKAGPVALSNLVAAPLVNLKMMYWDLAKHSLISTLRTPLHAVLAPKRLLEGTGEALADMPKHAITTKDNLINNTRTTLENIVGLRPIQAMKSGAELIKQGVKDTIVSPTRSLLKPLIKPVQPFTNDVKTMGNIVYESKKQYLTRVVQFYRDAIDGTVQIAKAPFSGNEFKMEFLENMRFKSLDPDAVDAPQLPKSGQQPAAAAA